MISAFGTYLPPWGSVGARVAGPDEDAVTMAVAAGRHALSSSSATPRTVVFVTRDLPLLEGGNGAALLAGLGLDADVEVIERVGGAPAALDSVTSASADTLVVAADMGARAGAAAALVAGNGLGVTSVIRTNRSLPVRTRSASGATTDYDDPRLLRDRGLLRSLDLAGLAGKFTGVAGLDGKEANALCEGDRPVLATVGASSALFALAALAERRDTGRVLAVEQATVTSAELDGGTATVTRDEPIPQPLPPLRTTPGPDIKIALAAYERAFDEKLRLDAGRCVTCATLAYPTRYRCLGCGSEAPVEMVALPRNAVVYTAATVHVPVPGLGTPYTLIVAELGDTGVRLLVHLTGAPAGAVAIGDEGQLVFRRVALRSGVPDYGYGFLPGKVA